MQVYASARHPATRGSPGVNGSGSAPYRHDANEACRLKPVELIVETVPWSSRECRPRRRDEEMVAVRIGYEEHDLRERAKRLGALWRPNHRLWEMRWLDAKHLGIADRVAPN